ncbi:siderophore ABC transporter substrate-binding protein [Sedimentitalea sp. XS_ASV28]|uniref:siderophore ABC transporter substrate-binding protein n=1 Tax=Sedimentitalea sp. XS_ASV28 TaxID=3241296 RepID=UPI0035197FBB
MSLRFLRYFSFLVTLSATSVIAEPITVETAAGPMTVAERPESIVALDVAAIDTLTALGVAPSGVVAPLFVNYLDEATAGLPAVGSLFEPDFEAIAALNPDLIVVGGRSVAMADALSTIAPVADMTIGTDMIADGLSRLDAYAALTGTGDTAEDLRRAISDRLERARAMVADRGNVLILMTNGPKLSVFGRDSRFGWLHTALNWPQAVDDISESRHGEAVTFEYIAAADPDTLVVIDRGQAVGEGTENARATLDNDLIHDTRAWQSGRVIYLTPAETYIAAGGTQAIIRTLDDLIAALAESA